MSKRKIELLEDQVAKLIHSNKSLRYELKKRPKVGGLTATNLTAKELSDFACKKPIFMMDDVKPFQFKDPRDPNNFPFHNIDDVKPDGFKPMSEWVADGYKVKVSEDKIAFSEVTPEEAKFPFPCLCNNKSFWQKHNHSIICFIQVVCGLTLIAVSLFSLSARAECSKVYAKVGAGYKFDEQNKYTFKGQDYYTDPNKYSARFELGVECARVNFGISHHSQWATGAPFNDIGEPYKSEVFIDVKFDLWDL